MTLRNGKKLVIKKCKVWGGSQSGSADGYYPGFGWAFSADFDLHTICNDRHWSTNEIHEDILTSDDPLNSKEVEVYDYNYYEDKVLTNPDSYLHDTEVNLIRSQHSPVAILKLTKDEDGKEFWKLIEE
jgi:hypothetical protein